MNKKSSSSINSDLKTPGEEKGTTTTIYGIEANEKSINFFIKVLLVLFIIFVFGSTIPLWLLDRINWPSFFMSVMGAVACIGLIVTLMRKKIKGIEKNLKNKYSPKDKEWHSEIYEKEYLDKMRNELFKQKNDS